jgi:hypothetical protein
MTDAKRAFDPPEYDETVLYSIRALADGQASDGQQKLAFEWIMRSACALNSWAFCAGGDDGQRSTDLLLGRQMVGHVLYDMLQPKALERLQAKKAAAAPRIRRGSTQTKGD